MEPEFVLLIAQDAFKTISMVGGPVILVSLALGLVVALFQAATQVNEASLSFVPKLIGAGGTILFLGSWMLDTLMTFAINLYQSIPSIIGS